MFNKEYYFYGKHAEYINKLTGKSNNGKKSNKNKGIFNSPIDILPLAGIIGLTYNKRAEVDNNKNEKGEVIVTSISSKIMISKSDEINQNYQAVMMLHNRNIDSEEVRLDRSFRYDDKDEDFKRECYHIFNSYVLGGIELMYEKIMGNGKTLNDYRMNLFNLLNDFKIRYEETSNKI